MTIDVTDVAEQPLKPDKPTLAPTAATSTALTVTWTKPGLNGGPEITGYRLAYRGKPTDGWIDVTTTGPGSDNWSIGGLTPDTSYQARVQAVNGETPSDWSEPSDAARTHPQGETLDSVDVTSTPRLMSSGALTPDTYGAGEAIRFTVTFSGAVDVTGDPIFQFYFSNNGVLSDDRRSMPRTSPAAARTPWSSPTP